MTPAEIGKLLIILFQVLALIALIAFVVHVIRSLLEKRVRASMKRNSDSLVGKRAMVMTDLRPKQAGSIRPIGSSEDEAKRATQKEDSVAPFKTYPAFAEQLISRGRVVRVTGGDPDGYLVRPL
ncbi:MAG: hypothetical protein GX850_03525 [Clostridiaceae bacterium]|jgi:hypothetical protein|nr:hypothetical protein [Clostridiaceae bacterium]